MSSLLAAQGFVTFPDTSDWMHRFQIKSGTSARVYMIGRHRATGVWVCSCMGFRSSHHCKHLRSAWHVLAAVDKLEGAQGGAQSSRDVDFEMPWLPLPDDDFFMLVTRTSPLGSAHLRRIAIHNTINPKVADQEPNGLKSPRFFSQNLACGLKIIAHMPSKTTDTLARNQIRIRVVRVGGQNIKRLHRHRQGVIP
jgi:hypothetical protein